MLSSIVTKLKVSLALSFYYTDLGLRRDGSDEGTRRSENELAQWQGGKSGSVLSALILTS